MTGPRRRAFSLVELLVVVTIIVVLLSLLSPALESAIHRAELIVCQANTRAVAMATLDYTTRYRGAIPVYDTWTTHMIFSNNPGFAVEDARDFLLALVGRPQVLYCPLGKLKFDTPGKGWDTPVTATSVALEITYSPIGIWQPTENQRDQNWPGWKTMYTDLPVPDGGTNRPTRLANTANASSIAIIVDSQVGYQGGTPGASYPGHPAWANSPNQTVYPHRRADLSWEGTSSSFFDGHSEHRYFEEFFDEDAGYPFGARWFMWRYRGETQPESPYWW